MKKERRRIKLGMQTKTIIIISVFALLLSTIAMFFFTNVIRRNNTDYYTQKANSIASTTAEVIEHTNIDKMSYIKEKILSILDEPDVFAVFSDEGTEEELNAYIAHFDKLNDDATFVQYYDYLKGLFGDIVKSNSYSYNQVNCIYLSVVREVKVNPANPSETKPAFIYLIDSAPEEDACPPGWVDPLYDVNKEVITNPSRGFPAYITDTSYGWLCTAGAPIYSDHLTHTDPVGYAMVDIDMGSVQKAQADSIGLLAIFLVSTVVALCILGFIIIRFLLVKPVRKLIDAAKTYDKGTDSYLQNIEIKTGDEIEDLANSLKDMEKEIQNKVKELESINEQLTASRIEASEKTRLANKDALTGVRNKFAYNSASEALNKEVKDNIDEARFGIVMIDLNDLKVINDKFGHEAGDVALIKLSSFVCATFAHSPVFRYGGDEFVVILKNVDYDNVESLVKYFKKKVAGLQKDDNLKQYEKVSAAIGYALFDKTTDTSVHDVFNRADERMYENKKEMKKQRL